MDLLFKDRTDAGVRLAKRLTQYQDSNALVLAIPRGGAPVAAAVAARLGLEWHVILVRKLPIPWNPEAGFGAVTLDGAKVLNERMVHELRMSRGQIDEVAERAVQRLSEAAKSINMLRPPPDVDGRNVIVVDDGLATGYTMLAAIKSLRGRNAGKVVAAAPVASRTAADLVRQAADECVIEVISPTIPFAVADHYLQWHDLAEEEVMACFQPAAQPPKQ
jgi:putative phosphoribosyl transferase